jgi:WD40 repeat protein
MERQLTTAAHGHFLTNINCWTHDGQWIVYDIRSVPDGSVFDGQRIERIHASTGEVQLIYESKNGATCGVVTASPVEDKVAFIHGPEHPTPDWTYYFTHRQGAIVELGRPGIATNLEARDIVPPFTPGALRGGSHVHVFSGDGQWISFTYEDHVLDVLDQSNAPAGDRDLNQRNIGVSLAGNPVRVPKTHPRNQDGNYFTVQVSKTVPDPKPGSDEIKKACEEGWVGVNGYLKPDGTRQKKALAMQGQVVTAAGETISEVFLLDLPDDLTIPGEGPLEGTATRSPSPPMGVLQRRLTYTALPKFPGLQGPRHWLRCSPDGTRIAFLLKDDGGIVQLWTISPNGGEPVQLTHSPWSITSTFTWSADGRRIACAMDNSVFVIDATTGAARRLTERTADDIAPRPEACVFSPDGSRIAFVRNVPMNGKRFNQIFVVSTEPG